MSNKYQNFMDYLQEVHANQYKGFDDDMPDDFEKWLQDKDVEDIIAYANRWAQTIEMCSICKMELATVNN